MKIARKIAEVTGINLVGETSGLMVISQSVKIIRIDTKSIRAAGRNRFLTYLFTIAISFRLRIDIVHI